MFPLQKHREVAALQFAAGGKLNQICIQQTNLFLFLKTFSLAKPKPGARKHQFVLFQLIVVTQKCPMAGPQKTPTLPNSPKYLSISNMSSVLMWVVHGQKGPPSWTVSYTYTTWTLLLTVWWVIYLPAKVSTKPELAPFKTLNLDLDQQT